MARRKIKVKVTPDRLPQVTIYADGKIIGTGRYAGPLGLCNANDWATPPLTQAEWEDAKALVRIWRDRPKRRTKR